MAIQFSQIPKKYLEPSNMIYPMAWMLSSGQISLEDAQSKLADALPLDTDKRANLLMKMGAAMLEKSSRQAADLQRWGRFIDSSKWLEQQMAKVDALTDYAFMPREEVLNAIIYTLSKSYVQCCWNLDPKLLSAKTLHAFLDQLLLPEKSQILDTYIEVLAQSASDPIAMLWLNDACIWLEEQVVPAGMECLLQLPAQKPPYDFFSAKEMTSRHFDQCIETALEHHTETEVKSSAAVDALWHFAYNQLSGLPFASSLWPVLEAADPQEPFSEVHLDVHANAFAYYTAGLELVQDLDHRLAAMRAALNLLPSNHEIISESRQLFEDHYLSLDSQNAWNLYRYVTWPVLLQRRGNDPKDVLNALFSTLFSSSDHDTQGQTADFLSFLAYWLMASTKNPEITRLQASFFDTIQQVRENFSYQLYYAAPYIGYLNKNRMPRKHVHLVEFLLLPVLHLNLDQIQRQILDSLQAESLTALNKEVIRELDTMDPAPVNLARTMQKAAWACVATMMQANFDVPCLLPFHPALRMYICTTQNSKLYAPLKAYMEAHPFSVPDMKITDRQN